MSINFDHRPTGEDGARPDAINEAGRNLGQEDATHEQNDRRNSTAEHPREALRERGLFLPLAWAELAKSVKPQPFRGRSKRKSLAAAINAKRNQGNIDADSAGPLALALVAGVLLVGA